jgi:putative intracellular protease/amidase
VDLASPAGLTAAVRPARRSREKKAMWSSFAVRDGKPVTGQNPQSSAETARDLLAAIRS